MCARADHMNIYIKEFVDYLLDGCRLYLSYFHAAPALVACSFVMIDVAARAYRHPVLQSVSVESAIHACNIRTIYILGAQIT
jgi:hypothetical protein